MKKLGQRWVKAIERSDSINEWVPFVAEIACGSRQKYALDKRSGRLLLHRALGDGLTYPTNYGFIPRTRAEADGMELDLMTLTGEPLLPLAIAKVRIVGGCTLSSKDKPPEDKLLGVVVADPSVAKIKDIGDVDGKLKAKIEQVFIAYKQDEGDTVRFERWFDRPMAIEKLKQGFALAKYARHK
jgi:inorganic pyrophosphatase